MIIFTRNVILIDPLAWQNRKMWKFSNVIQSKSIDSVVYFEKKKETESSE